MTHLPGKIFRRIRFVLLNWSIRELSSSEATRRISGSISGNDNDRALKSIYDRYITDISRGDMAASYECTTFLILLCKLFSFQKIVDFGSGFSSYALRQYAVNEENLQVWSVDDDDSWLEKTSHFLQTQNVNTQNLVRLDDFIRSNERDFNLIFLDLNFVEVRKSFIKLAADRCTPGGMIVFDDVHKPDFMYEVLSQGKECGLAFFNIKHYTLDGYGRFALLAIKHV